MIGRTATSFVVLSFILALLPSLWLVFFHDPMSVRSLSAPDFREGLIGRLIAPVAFAGLPLLVRPIRWLRIPSGVIAWVLQFGLAIAGLASIGFLYLPSVLVLFIVILLDFLSLGFDAGRAEGDTSDRAPPSAGADGAASN